jgi:hypothetical protein
MNKAAVLIIGVLGLVLGGPALGETVKLQLKGAY